MARYGQRPENALKRAHEFIGVGKSARALDTLQDVFRNKKWAYNWSESVLEPIMFKYLELCVELKKSHIAKEGLFQYRNMFQAVNVGSLENVIRGYLRMAEEKTENAREQSAQAVIDIDDLDNLATPESILLSAVSGEDAQDRSDRTILTPWVKFLWESYCQCLELLRINSHVETLYHDIARMAFQFCLKYNRKTEFRKLCDKLRKHLEDICKLPSQITNNVSISKPETQQLNLETRLFQLDSAIQMELWQEAYKAIEDIHGLMNMSKKQPIPKTMANYYQKLAMVFWKAGNYLFHAAALFKLFQLSKEMKKNITSDELHKMACRVMIATLAIPLPSAHPEFDRFIETDKSPFEKAQRLAILLGLQQPPTRQSLLKDIIRTNVLSLASPNIQEMYKLIEVDFDPLSLCDKVQVIVGDIEKSAAENAADVNEKPNLNSFLQQYIPALQDVTLVRLVRQVAQVYQTIEFSRILALAKFTTAFHFERLLVDCVRHNDMQIRIDHGAQCIRFGMDLSESQREDRPEGPTLQTMPSEQIRNQLVNMANVLHQATAIINPNRKKTDLEKRRKVMVASYQECKYAEHQRILERHQIIEDRKEYIERQNTYREEQAQRKIEEYARQQALAAQKRLQQEQMDYMKRVKQTEMEKITKELAAIKISQISSTVIGKTILKKMDEETLMTLDADQIAEEEAKELQKERRELQAKLKSQEKKVDYFERAKRLEEIPLLQDSMKERQAQDQAFWEQQEKERIALALEERTLALVTRERLMRLKADKDNFVDKLFKDRSNVYEDKLKNFERTLAAERAKRMQLRREERKEERRLKYWAEKEAEEQRRVEEQIRIEAEERAAEEAAARKLQEEKEKAEREERERQEKLKAETLERIAAKQRQREKEIEMKLLEDQEKGRSAATGSSAGGGGGSDQWRRSEAKPAAASAATDGGAAAAAADQQQDKWRSSGGAGVGADAAAGSDATKKSEPWRPRPRGEKEVWRRGGDDADRKRDGDRDRDARGDDKRGGDDTRRRDDFDRDDRRRDDRDRRPDERRRYDRDDRDRRVGGEDREMRRDDRDRRGGDDKGRRVDDRDRRGDDRDRRGEDRRGDDRERRGDDRRGDGYGRDWRRDNTTAPRTADDGGGVWRQKDGGDRKGGEPPAARRAEKEEGRESNEDGWSYPKRR